jgi:hypothetical protein
MTVITVSSGKGVLFTKLVLGGGILALGYYFLSAIAFFGFFIALNLAALFYIYKMNISEEAQRLGRRGNAILGFMGMIAVQVIVLRNSNFVDVQDINLYVVAAERKDLEGYSILMIGASLILFVATYNIVKMVKEEFPVDPPPGLLYTFTATSSLGSSLLMYGFFFQYGAIYVDMSPNTFLEIRVKEAGVWLVIALFAMYFLMARLKFKTGDCATVYFFGIPIYSLTAHRDLMVPVLSAALHFITELADQHPIGFSVDFTRIREELWKKERYDITVAPPGEQMPVRLDGKRDDPPRPPTLPPGARQNLLPPPPPPPDEPSGKASPAHKPLKESPNRVNEDEGDRAPRVSKASPVPPPPSPPPPAQSTQGSLRDRIIKRGDELKPKPEVAGEGKVPAPEPPPPQGGDKRQDEEVDPEQFALRYLRGLTKGGVNSAEDAKSPPKDPAADFIEKMKRLGGK